MPVDGQRSDAVIGPYQPVPVACHPWDPRAPEVARRVGAIIRGRLPAAAVEHVGSTAVPGMPAKPIIDIAVGIPRFEDAPRLIEALAQAGYEHVPEFTADLPGWLYFRLALPDGAHSHHLHMYERGNPELERVLTFRDRLRADADVARAYESLKRDLASRFGRREYTAGKGPFIRSNT
jgi:GrpB-like predicted nucleotidyltransferase (UPF0157 family)